MSQANLDELRLDLEEVERLQKSAARQRVQDLLSKEVDKLRRDILSKEKAVQGAKATSSSSTGSGDNTQIYQENITNYAWDQSDKFLKLYLTLGNLSVIDDSDILADFSNRSVTIKVQFPKKTCQMHIARLCEEIVPSDCYCKKKSEYVLVMLKKAEVGRTWQTVTEREKKAKEKDRPTFENEDPSASITKMLKNMYDDGDDEMKRSISKAWYESQMKSGAGAGPLPEM
ncbi:hypothetical protein BsWGS_08582 [Bradybaena similaris]